MKELFQLKISLQDSHPEIWRRVLVPKNISFYKLHFILQATMGWDNYHLYEFRFKNMFIGESGEVEHMIFDGPQTFYARNVYLNDVLKVRNVFKYLYDFSEAWMHHIKIEKEVSKDPNLKYPLCLEGVMACPPDDCGGIIGYYYMLQALKDPNHNEYDYIKRWLGSNFDPNTFDLDIVNAKLRRLKIKF